MFEKRNLKGELKSIEAKLEKQENWEKYDLLSKDLKRKNYISNFIDTIERNSKNYQDTIELLSLSEKSNSQELLRDLKNELSDIKKDLSKLYLETLMSGKADSKNTLMEIHSGAGGIESQDWVEMLLRMYSRWSDARG